MKKSYNPFKMFGAYLGAIVGVLASWLFPVKGATSYNFYEIFNLVGISGISMEGLYNLFIYSIIGLVIGFIIGWIIHSAFRLFKK